MAAPALAAGPLWLLLGRAGRRRLADVVRRPCLAPRRHRIAGPTVRCASTGSSSSSAAVAAVPPEGGTSLAEDGLGPWCAYYINLARREDRRTRLAQTLGAANGALLSRLERIEAVDGKFVDIDNEDLHHIISEGAMLKAREAKDMGAVTIVHREGELVKFHDYLTEGGVACAMSHRVALEAVAFHPTADWGLILEDDVSTVVPQVHEVIRRILQRLPSNWDAVFLGYHGGALAGTPGGADVAKEHRRAELELQLDVMRGEVDGFSGSIDLDYDALRPGADFDPPLLRMYMPLYGLYAWMVRKPAAMAALDGAFPIDGQVDHALSNWLVRERGRCFRVAPQHMLFYSPKSEDALDSDVQAMTSVDGLMEDPKAWERYSHFLQKEEEEAALKMQEIQSLLSEGALDDLGLDFDVKSIL